MSSGTNSLNLEIEGFPIRISSFRHFVTIYTKKKKEAPFSLTRAYTRKKNARNKKQQFALFAATARPSFSNGLNGLLFFFLLKILLVFHQIVQYSSTLRFFGHLIRSRTHTFLLKLPITRLICDNNAPEKITFFVFFVSVNFHSARFINFNMADDKRASFDEIRSLTALSDNLVQLELIQYSLTKHFSAIVN